jgi:NAD(P)-dependent dehydrogenase (short-subunit alcohol dehydrogenase family)
MKRFSDKVVVVTGGASGMGAAACRLFAAEGGRVVGADIDGDAANRLAKEIGGRSFQVDVAKEAGIRDLVAFAAEGSGRLDVLFNNAAVGHSATGRYKMASIVDTPEDAWEGIVAINMKGVAFGCKHAIPLMLAQGGGAIVNNASIQAIKGILGADAYTCAKGGVVSLTRTLAVDWGPKNIRVNCVCPGPIATPMIQDLLDDPAIGPTMYADVPLGRAGSAEEVAKVAVFLASDDASYVNGAIVPVDGGMYAR